MQASNYRPMSASALGFTVGETPSFRLRPLPALIALSLGLGIGASTASAAPPLPQNGQFAGGAGKITASGGNLDITQSSSRGIINWNSFSIGAGSTVTINNGSGATLNRVTGNDMSTINGTLKATGSVYLINPHGVVIGSSGVVTTGGRFVASTLDVDNTEFMDDFGSLGFSGKSNGTVINLGKISSTGGDVFLISRSSVVNAGTISAPNGTAEMAVGNQVSVSDYAYGTQVSVALPSHGSIVNSGTVQAAQINLQAADGNIYALAGTHSALRATGTETRNGRVMLVAANGGVDAHGATIASKQADGTGGEVDTTANTLNVGGAKVSAGQWNLAAPAFTIGAPTAAALANSLNGGAAVTLKATGATGNITVGSDIRWTGASSLALNANHSVTVGKGATVANTGAGKLTIRADAASTDTGGSVVNNGTIDWSRSTGTVTALYDINGSYKAGKVLTNAAWAPAAFSGLATQYTAYRLVNSVADLNAINNAPGANYALGMSFDLGSAGTSLRPIGSAANPFTGQFDGMGNLLSTLTASDASSSATNTNTGLFGVIGATGIVRNFDLVGSTASSARGPVGLLTGVNQGRVVGVGTTGSVSTTAENGTSAGGLVGVNSGSIERSWSGAGVSGKGSMGGVAGQNDGSIVQSYSLGYVSGDATSSVGGLAGANRGTISQSYSSGSANGGRYVGGLVGNNGGVIQESYTAASLSPGDTSRAGGIAGNNTGTIASGVYWNADFSGATSAVGSGIAAPASSRMTTAQMSNAASFGSGWNFGPTGAWILQDGDQAPQMRWIFFP